MREPSDSPTPMTDARTLACPHRWDVSKNDAEGTAIELWCWRCGDRKRTPYGDALAAAAEADTLRRDNERLRADLATFTTEPDILTRVGEANTRYWFEKVQLADRTADTLRSRVAALEKLVQKAALAVESWHNVKVAIGLGFHTGSWGSCDVPLCRQYVGTLNALAATPTPATDEARCECGHLRNRHTPDTCCTCDGLDGPHTGACNGFRTAPDPEPAP